MRVGSDTAPHCADGHTRSTGAAAYTRCRASVLSAAVLVPLCVRSPPRSSSGCGRSTCTSCRTTGRATCLHGPTSSARWCRSSSRTTRAAPTTATPCTTAASLASQVLSRSALRWLVETVVALRMSCAWETDSYVDRLWCAVLRMNVLVCVSVSLIRIDCGAQCVDDECTCVRERPCRVDRLWCAVQRMSVRPVAAAGTRRLRRPGATTPAIPR